MYSARWVSTTAPCREPRDTIVLRKLHSAENLIVVHCFHHERCAVALRRKHQPKTRKPGVIIVLQHGEAEVGLKGTFMSYSCGLVLMTEWMQKCFVSRYCYSTRCPIIEHDAGSRRNLLFRICHRADRSKITFRGELILDWTTAGRGMISFFVLVSEGLKLQPEGSKKNKRERVTIKSATGKVPPKDRHGYSTSFGGHGHGSDTIESMAV